MAAIGISQNLWDQLSIANQQAYLASGAKSIYEFNPAAAGLLLTGSNINDAFTAALSRGDYTLSTNGIAGIQNLGTGASSSSVQSALTTGNYQVLPTGEIKYVQNATIVAGPVSSTTTTPGSSTPGTTSIFDNIPKITVALTGIAAVDKLLSKLNESPTYLDTIKSVKDGSIFKTVSSAMDDMSNTVSGLGSSATNAISALKAGSLSAMSNITKDFGKYLSLAQTSMDMKAKAIISQGGVVTESDLISAAGPLKAIADSVSSIKTTASSLASQMSSIEQQLGMSLSTFKNLIPPIGSPEYDQFLIDNPDKMALLDNANNLVNSVSTGINGMLSSATSGLQDTIKSMVSDLKAAALVSQIIQSSNPVIAKIKTSVIDATKVDTAIIQKTLVAASKIENNLALPVKDPKTTGIIPAGYNQLEPIKVPPQNKEDCVYKDEIEAYRTTYFVPACDKQYRLKVETEKTSEWAIYEPAYIAAKRLVDAKPDSSGWSNSEKAVYATYKSAAEKLFANTTWQAYSAASKLAKEEGTNLRLITAAYDNKSPRSVLPAVIRGRLIYEKDFAAASVYKV